MERKKDSFVHPDGGYGWVIVFGIILINTSLLTLVQCFGLIFRDEFAEWGVSSAKTSFLLHLHSSLYCSFGFFSSPILKKYGMRKTAYLGATLMCLGIFLSSFASSFGTLIFSVSILIGIGQGILMPATYLANYTYFKKRLTVAVSLSVTGASLSPIVMPKICDMLLSRIGRTHTVLILFAISLLSFVGCYLFKPIIVKDEIEEEATVLKEVLENHKDIPVEIRKDDVQEEFLRPTDDQQNIVYQNTTVPIPVKSKIQQDTLWAKISNMFDLHLLKDVPFVIIVLGLGVSFASELNIILLMQFILRELSLFNRSQVATAVSIQSVADIIGRLVIPLLAHFCKASPKFMYCGALVVACLGRTILSIWPQTELMIFVAISIIGLTKGCRAVFQSVILPKYVPLSKLPAANGLNMLFTGTVSLIIGPLLGAIRDQSNSYIYALHTASGISLLCVILWIMESIFWKTTPVN